MPKTNLSRPDRTFQNRVPMRGILYLLPLFLYLPLPAPAQDFILEGCFWGCTDDASGSEGFAYWSERLAGEAPALIDAGFTYIWISSKEPALPAVLAPLATALHRNGLAMIIETENAEDLRRLMPAWEEVAGIRDFCLPEEPTATPTGMADLLRQRCARDHCPHIAIARTNPQDSPRLLAEWTGSVIRQLGSLAGQVSPRVLDYPLREALRRATTDPRYDLRGLYRQSIRDATSLSGFNLVTFVNGRQFQDANGISGDFDDPIREPLLAYVYLLTNNQLGLPVIAASDYLAPASEEADEDPNSLRHQIDQLLLAHRQYIFNSTALEYLNAEDSPRKAHYLSATEGAGPDRALIFQMDGTNTPAGLAAGQSRDVIVAINFADTTLRVIQEINLANHLPGDHFTDILNRSGSAILTVAYREEQNIPDAVYLEVPPRSYAIWVAGEAPRLEPSLVDLQLRSLDRFVEVQWEVPAEINIRGYSVERSINGQPFADVHWENAVGAGPESGSYLFLDEDVFPGEELYYRIKMINKEGGYEYSTVEKTRMEGLQLEVRLSEDQDTGGKRLLQIKSSYEAAAEITVFNAKGEAVQTLTRQLHQGLNYAEIDLLDLPAGVYFISLAMQNRKRWSERIIKY